MAHTFPESFGRRHAKPNAYSVQDYFRRIPPAIKDAIPRPEVKWSLIARCIMLHSKRRSHRRCESRPDTWPEIRLGHIVTEDLLLGAKGVHDALCAPATQRIGNFETASATVAARHVSGDFVVSFELAGSWFLALGDLMGKGLPAAMWLTHVLDLLRRSCETSQDLSDIMQSLNREMHRSRVGVPLTSLFLARLDPAASSVTYSCGGCPPAFLLTGRQTVTMLQSGGPILGAVERATLFVIDNRPRIAGHAVGGIRRNH